MVLKEVLAVYNHWYDRQKSGQVPLRFIVTEETEARRKKAVERTKRKAAGQDYLELSDEGERDKDQPTSQKGKKAGKSATSKVTKRKEGRKDEDMMDTDVDGEDEANIDGGEDDEDEDDMEGVEKDEDDKSVEGLEKNGDDEEEGEESEPQDSRSEKKGRLAAIHPPVSVSGSHGENLALNGLNLQEVKWEDHPLVQDFGVAPMNAVDSMHSQRGYLLSLSKDPSYLQCVDILTQVKVCSV
jgi:hypothetical protein